MDKIVSSLDWLLFDPDQIMGAIHQCNAQMRIFLGRLTLHSHWCCSSHIFSFLLPHCYPLFNFLFTHGVCFLSSNPLHFIFQKFFCSHSSFFSSFLFAFSYSKILKPSMVQHFSWTKKTYTGVCILSTAPNTCRTCICGETRWCPGIDFVFVVHLTALIKLPTAIPIPVHYTGLACQHVVWLSAANIPTYLCKLIRQIQQLFMWYIAS